MSLAGPDDEGALPVIVTSLEITSDEPVIPARPVDGAALVEVTAGKAAASARFYREVGADWLWVDRLGWGDEQWAAWTDRPGHHLLEARLDGEAAGYAELDEQGDGSVELAYFGLLPAFIGRGLGGWLLERALLRAREIPGVDRVWVHTCTLDGPAALANYRARGMRDFATETEWRLVPRDG